MLARNTSTKVECKGFGFWSKHLVCPIQKRFENYQKQDLRNLTPETYINCCCEWFRDWQEITSPISFINLIVSVIKYRYTKTISAGKICFDETRLFNY